MSGKDSISICCLEKFCVALLKRAGLDQEKAAILTESLLFADIRGVPSHGIVRLLDYMTRIHAGAMAIDPEMQVEQDHPASALLNANNGPGQIAGAKAMAMAIDKARTGGVGLVGVKNSNHFGIAAYFAMQALKEDMVGLVTTNAAPSIAPYGAKVALVGTNPIAVAIPAAEQRPIVLDMSTSVVARGKIWLAERAGKKIPLGWARDGDGKPTDDPKAGQEGSLEPIGGPKGSGLSLVIDILCGVLTGTTLSGDVKLLADLSGPMETSHMFAAINIAHFVDVSQFKKNIDSIIMRVKSLPPIEDSSIYLPGEIEFNMADKNRNAGISLPANVLAGLNELADRYQVTRLGL